MKTSKLSPRAPWRCKVHPRDLSPTTSDKGPPPSPSAAADLHGEAWYVSVRALAARLEVTPPSARLPVLREALPEIHAHQDAFTEEVLAASPERPITCKAGCATCCHQWVLGVHAHEIAILGTHVLENLDRGRVRERLLADVAAFEALETPAGTEQEEEARAVAYLALRRPCIFLGPDARCTVHRIRPQACRTYFSLSPAECCEPQRILHPETKLFSLEPHRRATEALNQLDSTLPERLHATSTSSALPRALLTWLDRAMLDDAAFACQKRGSPSSPSPVVTDRLGAHGRRQRRRLNPGAARCSLEVP